MWHVELILLVASAACLFLAAVTVSLHPRINLLALGALLFVLVPLIELART